MHLFVRKLLYLERWDHGFLQPGQRPKDIWFLLAPGRFLWDLGNRLMELAETLVAAFSGSERQFPKA